MARTDVYNRILDELANGELEELEVKVFHFLRRVYPAPLTRYDLIEQVFGVRPAADENLNNNTCDRKIRTAISSMFIKGVPIVSTSGGAGYRIDIDLGQWTHMVAELESRKDQLERKIDAALRIMRTIETAGREAIPTTVPAHFLGTSAPAKPRTPSQMSFLGGN